MMHCLKIQDFKIVNPKYIESEEGNRNSKRKPNPDYNSEKPTYIQFLMIDWQAARLTTLLI